MKNKFILLLTLVTNIFSCPGWLSWFCGSDNPIASIVVSTFMAPIDALMDIAQQINNTTTITPLPTPIVVPQSCSSTGSSPNPFFASNGSACQIPAPQCCYENPKPARCTGCTMDCLIASAESSLAAGGLPILGLDVTGPKGADGKWPVIGQTYIKNSSGAYVNNSCVFYGPYSPSNNITSSSSNSMTGLLHFGNTCGSLTPFYTYIAKCLEDGKIDTPSTGYGRAYNNKVFFNNANVTFGGTSVNPIQCMACGTTGTISSCTVVNGSNNLYPTYGNCN